MLPAMVFTRILQLVVHYALGVRGIMFMGRFSKHDTTYQRLKCRVVQGQAAQAEVQHGSAGKCL